MAGVDDSWIYVAGLDGVEVAVAWPTASAQFRAITWLRWRLFVNSFRRKGGKGELIARIILFPFVAIIAIGPVIGAGIGGYYAVHEGLSWGLSLLMWAVFGGWIFITTATTLQPDAIDLTLLLRFPLKFRSYVITRFFFGLLAPPNVIGSLALAAAAIGVGVAQPNLFAWAAVDFFVYALMMILLLRMVLLWLDRWLAQRRTREIVGVLFTLFFLSFQFLNVQFQAWMHSQNGHNGFERFAKLLPLYRALRPVLALSPMELAANSVMRMRAGAVLPAVASVLGVAAFAVIFAGLFAYRLRGEFRGENFSEALASGSAVAGERVDAESGWQIAGLPSAIAGCIEKEVRYMTRGPSLLLSVLTPLVLVGIYVNRMGSSEFLLPGALAYTLFSMMPLLYNVLGQDAAGAQMYLLSPTPIRLVFLSKNLVTGALIMLVAAGAVLLVSYNHAPSAPIAVGTAFWFAFVLFVNLSAGNHRSIRSPAKVDLGKIQRRQGASQLSVLIVMGVLLGSLAVGFALMWTCRYFGYEWAAPAVLAVMAVAAALFYVRSLSRIEIAMMANRDVLVEVLGKG